MKKIRGIAVAAAMVACAVAAQWLRPVPSIDPDFKLEALIPSEFGEWRVDSSMVPVAPSPDVQAQLEQIYGQIVTRTYVDRSGNQVMLVVAYGGDQSDSLKVHRQEVCYAAQGFAIRSVRSGQLEYEGRDVELVRMHAERGRRSEPVSYWFTMGDRVVLGRAQRFLVQVGYGLGGRVPDGLLVRVSNLSRDVDDSFALHDRFLRDLLKEVGPSGRQRLAGLGGGAV